MIARQLGAPASRGATYSIALARDAADVRAAQRLRFEVFNLELHEGLTEAFMTGLDQDAFDEVCDHLIVRETATASVVGTYRLQPGLRACAALGYYSAREFSLAALESERARIIELGRACVAREHRNATVLGLLWRGIAHYARAHQARYLLGCSSLTSQDEAAALATFDQLSLSHLAPDPWRAVPQPAWCCRRSPGAGLVSPLPIPRLLRAYLGIGARICGEPAVDREFSSIDFLTWLDLESMPPRVAAKFLA